jgi:hypothetical protein
MLPVSLKFWSVGVIAIEVPDTREAVIAAKVSNFLIEPCPRLVMIDGIDSSHKKDQ